jgi:hypothetical protein
VRATGKGEHISETGKSPSLPSMGRGSEMEWERRET